MPYHDSQYATKPSYKVHSVYHDGFIKVLGNRYSVPYQYHGQRVKVQVTADEIIIVSLDDETHIYTHARSFEKGKKYKIRDHYKTPESESTIEMEKQLWSIFKDPQLIDELQKRFPRHYRDQYRQILRLAKQMNEYILQEALDLLLTENYQVSYSAIKRAALYLEEKMPLLWDLEKCKTVSFKNIPGLHIAERKANYYQEVVEKRQ